MILNDDETDLYGKAVARDDDASICVLAKNIVLDRNHEDLDNYDDDDDVIMIMMMNMMMMMTRMTMMTMIMNVMECRRSS